MKDEDIQKTEKPVQDSTLKEVVEPEESKKDEAFEKMRQEIDSLKEQLGQRGEMKAEYEPNIPPAIPASPIPMGVNWGAGNVDFRRFVDPTTGEFRADDASRAVNQAIDVNSAKNQNFAQNLIREEVDWAVARMKYPELDENQEFAEEVWGQYMIERQKNPNASPLDVTKKVQSRIERLATKEETRITQSSNEAVAEKEAASGNVVSAVPGAASAQAEAETEENEALLRAKTRGVIGNAFTGTKVSSDEQLGAIVERLKNKPWRKSVSVE